MFRTSFRFPSTANEFLVRPHPGAQFIRPYTSPSPPPPPPLICKSAKFGIVRKLCQADSQHDSIIAILVQVCGCKLCQANQACVPSNSYNVVKHVKYVHFIQVITGSSLVRPMPNGHMLSHCAYCELWRTCNPWGDDPVQFYCDDCLNWWDERVIWWQLGDVFLVWQAGQGIQRILSDDHLGCLISSYLTWHDVTGYGAWASDVYSPWR